MDTKVKDCVLVIDDQQMNLELAERALVRKYDIMTASSGEEGLELLQKNQNRVNLILLDIVLPEMNGFEFMDKMKVLGLGRVPVIIMTADHEPKKEIEALQKGAADFIRKPLYAQILLNRVENVLMRNKMEFDVLTGLYNRNKTFNSIRNLIRENPGKTFAFSRYDIDNFSIYNSSMGEKEGNRLLLAVTEAVKEVSKDYDHCVYGRIDADVFCMCEVYDKERLEKHVKEAQNYLRNYRQDYRLESSFGIYLFDDPEISIEKVFTNASLAAHTCKGIYDKNFAYYEDWMGTQNAEEQEIINEMVEALEQHEFVPYLQPKYDLESDRPCGAEALVRWEHPRKGMVSPGKFIPVFEKNGFISKLDYYMWESVCQILRKWIDGRQKVYPVSVNVSRVSLNNPNLDEVILDLVNKYELTPELLQLEVTESAYMTNPELMKNIIHRLQKKGFTILMDDFGSGYSSLNTLKEIHVDILKVDMKFLPNGTGAVRSEKILSSVIRMAGWLGIPTIAEGVETEAQRDFLKGIGCDYVQGFYYAKPMTVSQYEVLIGEGSPLKKGDSKAGLSTAAWSSDEKISEILTGIQLPIAIVEKSSSRTEIVRVNLLFNDILGRDYQKRLDKMEIKRIDHILAETIERECAEGEFQYMTLSGKKKFYRMRAKCIERISTASLICVTLIDITAEKTYGMQLKKLDRLMPATNRTKMLIADDSKVSREIIKALFSDMYDICETDDGKKALEVLEQEQENIAIILLDMVMPVMDGREFLEHKNRMEGANNIPVIVTSAETDSELQLHMLESGVNDYITKPFDSNIFRQKVKNAILFSERFVKLRSEYEQMVENEIDM